MGNEEHIREKVQNELGDGYEISVVECRKNNGATMRGLSAKKDGSAVSPVVYFTDGAEAGEEIKRMADALRCVDALPDSMADMITDFGKAKERICFKLINTGKNTELLNEAPHRNYLDLSAVYFISVDLVDGNGSVTIKNDLMERWGTTEQELWELAFSNTQKLFPPEIHGIGSLISSLADGFPVDGVFDEAMLVATNGSKTNGFAVIFYDDVLTRLTDRLGDRIFILPSSVHELITIADDGNTSPQLLKDMVRDINRKVLDEQEFLSDSVYRYEKGGKMTIAE